MKTWVKPNKTEIQLNEELATIEMAKQLGWKEKAKRAKKATKEQVESNDSKDAD